MEAVTHDPIRTLETSPEEVQLLIYDYLSPREWGVLATVAKFMKGLVEDDALWRPYTEQRYSKFVATKYESEPENDSEPKRKRLKSSEPELWKSICKRIWQFYEGIHKSELCNLTVNVPSVVCDLQLDQGRVYGGCRDKMVRVWDGATGELIKEFEAHKNNVCCLQIYRGRIYTGSLDNTIRTWNQESYALEATLTGHIDTVFGLRVYEEKLISASKDKTVRVWNAENGSLIKVLESPDQRFRCLDVGDNRIYAGSIYGRISVWDATTYDFVTNIETSHGIVYSVKAYALKIFSAGTGDEGKISIWEAQTLQLVTKLDVNADRRQGNPNYKYTDFGRMRTLDVFDGNIFCDQGQFQTQKAFCGGNAIGVWDATTFQCLGMLKGHTDTIECIRVYAGRILSSSNNRDLCIWG